MTLSHKAMWRWLLFLNGGLLLVAAVFAAVYRIADAHDLIWFDCVVRQTLHIYCPGCGGSRAVMCLWRLDLAGAWFYYPPLPIACLLLIDFDLRLCADLLTRGHRFTTSYRARLWLIPAVAILLTFAVRTVCLLCFQIDLLGDILPH